MSLLLEAGNRFVMLGSVQLLSDDHEVAWAEPFIETNPNVAWAIGRYVEADRANHNKQYFAQAALEQSYATVKHTPVNINHDPARVRGHFVAADLMYPTGASGASTDDGGLRPYVETLAALYKGYFPDDFKTIQKAANEGSLAWSMEAVPTHLKCEGEHGCGKEFAYRGPTSLSYCACIQNRISDKSLVNPQFIGGALVIAPAKPAWSDADVYKLVASMEAELMSPDHLAEVQRLLDQTLELARIDQRMQVASVTYTPLTMVERGYMADGESVEMARKFSMADRLRLKAQNKTLPGTTSYPIETKEDWNNAKQAIGRVKPGMRSKLVAYLKRMGKALGVPATEYQSLAA